MLLGKNTAVQIFLHPPLEIAVKLLVLHGTAHNPSLGIPEHAKAVPLFKFISAYHADTLFR